MSLLRPTKQQLVTFPGDEAPRLLVSIDAEEEFDWGKPVSRERHSVGSMKAAWKTQAIFDRFGCVPTYVVDYPIAANDEVCASLSELCGQGRCTIGAHMHPWTNPPHEEVVSTYTSFPGNLLPDLEKRKLRTLTEIIQKKFNQRPVIYRAGRYGIGPFTAGTLEELGYKIDMSVVPVRDYSHSGGPDFSRHDASPYWFGTNSDLLELPITMGFTGLLRSYGIRIATLLNSPMMVRSHMPGLLARSNLLNRVYLTPEGMPIEEAKHVTRVLYQSGHRIFTVHYHSPSLEPGNTPYVRSKADLEKFLSWLESYFDFFLGELGGIPATPMQIYDLATSLRARSAAEPAPLPATRQASSAAYAVPETSAATQAPKCLVVATNFPPVRGGSAVVYGNLCKLDSDSVVVLTAWRSYATGEEISGWRKYDREAAFPIHRLELLRPPVAGTHWGPTRVFSSLTKDIPLMVRVVWKVRSLVKEYGIKVVCIGELVYGGWLVFLCRFFLKCKVIQYIHGEEITVHGYSRSERMRRVYLGWSDAIIAVSRFTRSALIELMSVNPAKIELIENGVDPDRFHVKPANLKLVERCGLAGKRIILGVGRLVERKGFDQVLTALPLIVKRHPDLHYVIVGEGPYRAQLEALARDKGVADNVLFAGAVSDEQLVDYYSMCEMFVMPNREMLDGDTEGFGLVFLEANACGKPVISGRAGGVLDAVRDGVNGLTVDGTDPHAVAGAITRLLEDRALYERLRMGGLEAARISTWNKRVEQFNALCVRLAAEGK